MSGLVLRAVEVDGRRVDVRLRDGRVDAIAATLERRPGDEVIDGDGGALLPGLHDHHIHLFATAALDRSVRCGPPAVRSAAELAVALRGAPGDGWIRGVGYHERVAGDLDRDALDALVGDRPVRIQHRSGAQWTLSSSACAAVGLDLGGPMPDGVELDAAGRATGRIRRADGWLRSRLPPDDPPDVAALSRRLAGWGVTGLTDATPVTAHDDLVALAAAGVVQRLQVTGAPTLADGRFPDGVASGPVKVVLPDHDLPALDEVVAWFRRAHGAGRPVAVHAVTREALVLALAAWDEVGATGGDRVEHASITPPALFPALVAHGLTVVTQPTFVAERGDAYLDDVDPADRDDLYRCASLLAAGVPVGGSTDAPYGDPDPWRAMVAAVERTAPDGRVVGPGEALDPRRALDLFLAPLADPGGPPRRVEPGAPADLVVLDAPLDDVLEDLDSSRVARTVVDGVLID
jgi:predicted amidohydrolase YtcJ